MSVRLVGVGGVTRSWIAAVLLMAVLGCGKAPDAGTVAVNGIVTLDGKPVDKASVAFIGNEGARLATAQTDNVGKFTIRASTGKNIVTVAKAGAAPPAPPSNNEPQLMPTAGEYQAMIEKVKNDFPAKYGDPKTSGLSFDIKEKMPDLEVALSSK